MDIQIDHDIQKSFNIHISLLILSLKGVTYIYLYSDILYTSSHANACQFIGRAKCKIAGVSHKTDWWPKAKKGIHDNFFPCSKWHFAAFRENVENRYLVFLGTWPTFLRKTVKKFIAKHKQNYTEWSKNILVLNWALKCD